jgi:hypothetical protein
MLANKFTIGHLPTKKYIFIPADQYKLINKEFLNEFIECCKSKDVTFKEFEIHSLQDEIDVLVKRAKYLLEEE